MKKSVFAIIILILFSIVAEGCDRRNPGNYYPLEVGNRWTFTTTDLSTNSTRKDVELIISREGQCYKFEKGEKLTIVQGSGIVNKNGISILRPNMKPGYKWYEFSNTLTVSQINQPYTVPAGTFNQTLEITWKISRPDKDDATQKYTDVIIQRYAKGIGPIYYYYKVIRPDGETVEVIKSVLEKFDNVRRSQ